MTNEAPPCSQELGLDCFEEHPEWAKQAFAYRLLMLLSPKALTRRLHRRLFRLLLAPGVEIPPGLILPPGTLIPPGVEPPTVYEPGDPPPPGVTVPIGTIFPPGWTPEDPAPPGVVIPPGTVFPPDWTPPDPPPPGTIPPGRLPPGRGRPGPTPPLYIAPWTPGPVSTRPPGGAAGIVYWMYDTFDTLDPARWYDDSTNNGVISIDAGRLKGVAPAAGDYATVQWATDEPTQPDTFTWTFDLNHVSGTGRLTFFIYTGANGIVLFFDPPTTFQYRNVTGAFTSLTIDTIVGTTDTWKIVYDGTNISVYRGAALIVNQMPVYLFSWLKGWRQISIDDGSTAYVDNYFIWET